MQAQIHTQGSSILTVIVFFAGAFVMILEIVGSRIVSPYIGTSLISWTSLIGVVLGSLSVGYYLGGTYVDKDASYATLAKILGIAALSVSTIKLLEAIAVIPLSLNITDLRISSLLCSLVLFSIPSICMGMVTPYAVGIKLHSLTRRGQIVGNLYAISTIGSIAGTFAAGFYLLPLIGNKASILFISLGLLGLSFLAQVAARKITARIITVYVFLTVAIIGVVWPVNPTRLVDIDTSYNRVWLRDTIDIDTNRPIRQMITGHFGIQSAVFLDEDNDLVHEYTKYYRLSDAFVLPISHALMIGGGGYSYPKDFLSVHPHATIDVVEIDSGLTKIAKSHFNLQEHPRMNIIHQDGRVFLNTTKSIYDAIFIDAFQRSTEIPDHLVSFEAFEMMANHLTPGGVILINVISTPQGEKSRITNAIVSTMKAVFPHVRLYPVGGLLQSGALQNIMIVGTRSDKNPIAVTAELKEYLQYEYPVTEIAYHRILTDDFSPLEYYSMEIGTD